MMQVQSNDVEDLKVSVGIVTEAVEIRDIRLLLSYSPSDHRETHQSLKCKYCENAVNIVKTTGMPLEHTCLEHTLLCTSRANNKEVIISKANALYLEAKESFHRQLVGSKEETSSLSNYSAAAQIRSKLAGTKRKSDIMISEGASKVGVLEVDLNSCSIPSCDLGISFLGTGSAAPSKTRNSSAILFAIPSLNGREKYVLIDSGEGCCAQLFYLCSGNAEKLRSILLNISLVWISHHHADHHCGLPMLLQQIQSAVINSTGTATHPKKVLVVASIEVIRYQEYCACISGLESIVEFVDIATTASSPVGKFIPRSQWERDKMQATQHIDRATDGLIRDLTSVSVYHCKNAYGLRLYIRINDIHKDTVSIVYR